MNAEKSTIFEKEKLFIISILLAHDEIDMLLHLSNFIHLSNCHQVTDL